MIKHIPELENLATSTVDVIFAPRLILRQLAITVILQTGVVTVSKLLRMSRYLLASMSKRTKEIRRLRTKIYHASNQSEWLYLAEAIDTLENNHLWRTDPNCELYESERLTARIDEFRHLIRRGDIFDMMFTLRGGIARSKYGLLHEGLFSRAMAGTKLLVEEYNAMICAGLDFVCDGDVLHGDDPIPSDARLAFFNETRHSYGRTAMLLSGGAALGFYHAGVVKALIENGLMPRVIGGASAGSILCAMIGTRTDEECLRDLFQVKGTTTPGHSGQLCLDFFRPQGYSLNRDYSLAANAGLAHDAVEVLKNDVGVFKDLKRFFQMLTPRALQWLSSLVFDVLTGNTRAKDILMNDSNHFRRCCRMNVGNFTFQEAFDRTGRIINVTVSPQNRSDPPRLLNYLTAPHVLVWSAAVASSSLPGVFEASKLMVKDSDGTERFESTSGARFVDGSMENDLPMQQLSEMFNVNHFIISQVNPHAVLIAGFSDGSSVWTNSALGFMNGVLDFLKGQIKCWVRNFVELAGGRRLAPLWELRRGFFTQLITQEYEGRESDITIQPWSNHRSMVSAFMHCLYNPSETDFSNWMLAAEKETWTHLPAIRSHCAVEMKLDKCVQKLRKRIVAESQNRQMAKAAQSNALGARVPSFYTSPSLINLSGLGVSDVPVRAEEYPEAGEYGGGITMDSGGSEDEGKVKKNSPSSAKGRRASMSGPLASPNKEEDQKYAKSSHMASFYYRKNKSFDKIEEPATFGGS